MLGFVASRRDQRAPRKRVGDWFTFSGGASESVIETLLSGRYMRRVIEAFLQGGYASRRHSAKGAGNRNSIGVPWKAQAASKM
jgi:hypothetical protein